MATSGSFSTSIYTGVDPIYPRQGTFSWYRTDYSVEGNYTDISWQLTASGGTHDDTFVGMKEKYVTVDGETWSNSTLVYAYNGTVLLSGTKRIYHDPDGTKSFAVSAGIAIFNYGSYKSTGSSTFNLDQIPRASGVSCSSPNIGDTATITIDKKSANFTNTITYDIGGITGTIATKTSDTVASLNTNSLKSQIYALMPNAKSTTGTIYCTTYNGDTQIGTTQSATFNLYAVESDCKPTVSGVVVDTNQDTIALTGSSSTIVKNASKPKVTITATPKYSSTISSYSINLNDGQTSNLQENTFDTINSSSITIDAFDSREYHNPQTINLSNRIINYVRLHFNTIDLQRTEETSNQVILNADGVWFNGSFSQNNTNTLTCTFQYKKSSDNSWTNGGTITPTISNNTFTFSNVSLGSVYNYEYEYQFKIIISDLLMTVGNSSADAQTVPKGVAVVEIGDEFVNVNGSLTKNNVELPVAKNTETSSQTDTYNCNYINNIKNTLKNDIDTLETTLRNDIETFAEIHTDVAVANYNTSGAIVEYWDSSDVIESGNFEYNSTHKGIKIPAGSCNVIQPWGTVCGLGYASVQFELWDDSSKIISGQKYGVLVQFAGNGYWKISMPNCLIVIPDTTKDYYLKMRASGYNATFQMNNGYGEYATAMGVRKVK